jgi:4-diphosphocytidyl-2-C-methyl-D-erythritol kinase
MRTSCRQEFPLEKQILTIMNNSTVINKGRLLVKLKAHAKINLTLGIKGLRPDGYHEVEMLMQSVDLHDLLTFAGADNDDIVLVSDSLEVPAGNENIVFKAADLLRRHTGCRRGVNINLQKRIPVAAGLAGGSTDAAAALIGLNIFWELGLTERDLFSLGERLGADVPFCLLGGTALARGKGEELTALPAAVQMGVLLVKPPFGVSTATVYKAYDGLPPGPQPDTRAMLGALRSHSAFLIAARLGNALERVTAAMHPEIEHIKKSLLAAGACGALMSGSGPTVFGLFPGLGEARKAAGKLNFPQYRVIVTATRGNDIIQNY